MKPPHMTARRWFWALMLSTILFMLINEKYFIAADIHAGPGFPAQMESWVRDNLASTLLAPSSYVLMWAQNRVTGKYGEQNNDTKFDPVTADLADYRLENDRLRRDNIRLATRVGILEAALKDYRELANFPSLSNPNNVRVHAKVSGFSQGQTNQTVIIDKGSSSGVVRGAFVLAQWCPVGRVISVGNLTSTVQLITDPARTARPMWVTVKFIRLENDSEYRLITGQQQIQGTTDGQLRCTTIDATKRGEAPAKGDIVVIDDNDWELVRGLQVGVVESVAKLETHTLRWDVRIRPLFNLDNNISVLVVSPPTNH